MTRDLTYYIEHPERVIDLTEDEINAWVNQYPYSQSIKWLKARYDLDLGLPSMRESVLAAAAATDDLVFLRYQLLHDSSKVTQLKDDLADAKTLAAKKEVIVEPAVEAPLTEVDAGTTDTANDKLSTTDEEVVSVKREDDLVVKENLSTSKDDAQQSAGISTNEKIEKLKTPKEVKRVVQKKTKTVVDESSISKPLEDDSTSPSNYAANMEVLPTAEMKARQVDDLLNEYSSEISGFSKWLLAQNKAGVVSNKKVIETDKKLPKKKKKKGKKKSKLEKLIDHSIVEREGVISETYANLLATQGYTQKAIELYQRLMLKFPEKSGYFAAKIDELQK